MRTICLRKLGNLRPLDRPVSARLACAVAFASCVVTASCSSISGYKVIPKEDGSVTTTKVRGLPILVKRPTRAVFIVTETVYAVSETVPDARTGQLVRRQFRDESETTISQQPILLGPSDIFTIDQKRPAAGKIDYSIEFEENYPKKISGNVQDETIEKVNKLLADIAEKLKPLMGVPPTVETKEAGAAMARTVKEQHIKLVIFDLQSGEVTFVRCREIFELGPEVIASLVGLFKEHEGESGILGVAVGRKEVNGQAAAEGPTSVTFVVPRKLPREGRRRRLANGARLLPKEVAVGEEPYITDVISTESEESGDMEPAPLVNSFTAGGPVSNLSEIGTVCCLVRRPGAPAVYALTNRHVAIGAGQVVYFPSPNDPNAIGAYTSEDYDLVPDEQFLHFVDAPNTYVDVDAALIALPTAAVPRFSPAIPNVGLPTVVFQPDVGSLLGYHQSVVGMPVTSWSWNSGCDTAPSRTPSSSRGTLQVALWSSRVSSFAGVQGCQANTATRAKHGLRAGRTVQSSWSAFIMALFRCSENRPGWQLRPTCSASPAYWASGPSPAVSST